MNNLYRCAHCRGRGATLFYCCYYKVFGEKPPAWSNISAKCCACDGSGYKRVGGPIFPRVG